MEPLTLQAATYRPTAPYTGTLPLSLLRVKNMILTGLDDLLYMLCYKGNLNLSETIATGSLTGTISGSINGTTITGAATAFKTELRSGQFVYAGTDFMVVNEVVSDTVFTIYRALTANIAALSTGYRLPILFELGRKRGTLLQGNGYEFDKGNIVAAGEGTLRVNGSELNGTSTGAVTNSVGTGSDDNAVGTEAWTDPDNISGAGVASSIPVGAAVTTHYLKGTNCGFAVPTGATIVGIQVEIRKRVTGAATETVLDSDVKIVKADGSIGATDKASAVVWPSAFAYTVYGGPADLWGEAWAPADINDTDFGAVISAVTTDPGGDSATLEVDDMQIAVFYTTATGMVLSRKPRIAVYDPNTATYDIRNLGLTPSTTAPTVASIAGGVKNMQIGHYSILLVPARTSLNGAGNPGPKAEFDIAAPGDVAEVDVALVTVDTTNGQEAFDVYASLSTQGGIQGPWFFLETKLLADIVGDLFTVEWEDSQIGRTGNEVDYDNDLPPEAGFIGTIVGYPVALSCNGKFGGTPGPSIVPAKPGNVDAWPAQWNVTSSPPENILGFATALARLYLLTPKSLQQAQYTPSQNAQVPPVTVRPYWRVGFANAYQLCFVNQMLVGHSLMGPTRSVEGNQEVVEQTDFGGYVSSIMATWTSGHVLVEHDPDPNVNAVCFFHSADSRSELGHWRTRVLIWGVRQEQWIGDVFIEDTNRDMIVCGVAQVDGHLEFLAGGSYGGAHQIEAITITSVDSTGNASVVITAAGMTGSPKTVLVSVTLGQSPSSAAAAIRAALKADSDVSAFFRIAGTGANVVLVKKLMAANDATMGVTISRCSYSVISIAGAVATTVQVDTFRWNTIASGEVDYHAAWQLTNAGAPRQDKELGAIQVTGKFTEGEAKVYGYSQTEAISLTDIEAGTNSLSGSISLGTQASPQDLERLELNISNAALFTARVGGTWDSTGDPDRLDKVVLEYQPVGMPR